MAHDEPSHQDLHCLQIQLFLSLVLKELSIGTPKSFNFPFVPNEKLMETFEHIRFIDINVLCYAFIEFLNLSPVFNGNDMLIICSLFSV